MSDLLKEVFNTDSVDTLSIILQEDPIMELSILGDEMYYVYKNNGVILNVDDFGISQIRFCFYEKKLTYITPQIDIIRNLKHDEIITFFGEPDDLGGGYIDSMLGEINPWIKYRLKKYDLHIEFSSFLTVSNLTFIASR